MKAQRKYKNLILFLVGQTVSQMGSALTGFSVIIWAYTQKGEVMASSLLAICSTVPYLLVSLLGGAVVDRADKKKIILVCDSIAAVGTMILLLCFWAGQLQLWILCMINILNGFMNAFQGPASQVAVSLLTGKEDYVRVGGLQSVLGAAAGVLNPILAAAFLSIGGLGLVLAIDLATFLFAFITLLLVVRIPRADSSEETVSAHTVNDPAACSGVLDPRGSRQMDMPACPLGSLLAGIKMDMLEGIHFLKKQKAIFLLLVSYSVLEFMGAISFDSMYSPLLLARTGNDEMTVGIVSGFMAAGCVASSLLLTRRKQPEKKIPVMFLGSLMCLTGILFFGMGRNIYWWCVVVFFGCFGSPIYTAFQTAILRELVPIHMQGRMFSMQGMITQILAPVGYLFGAILADYVFEPFMMTDGSWQNIFGLIVGHGAGAGMGLIFVLAGLVGIMISLILYRNPVIREMEVSLSGEN